MGELTPGTPLRLEDLARTLGMSISPIREPDREELALEGMAVRRASSLFTDADAAAARSQLNAYDEARKRDDIRTAMRAHDAFHFALYDAARSAWLLRLIRPAWDSCSRYRPILLAKGAVQDRHEELDVELLDACSAHDPERAARALHDHLETAADIYAVELKGRSIFAW
jgi:DNA-binding GntR family transcriptional regulator